VSTLKILLEAPIYAEMSVCSRGDIMNYYDPELLFYKVGMHGLMDNQLARVAQEIAGYDGDQLLNTPSGDLVPYFVEKYQLEVPTLHKDQAYVDQREGQVAVIDYFARDYGGARAAREITGTHVELTVPFSGDKEMFYVTPTTYNSAPPRAIVTSNAVMIRVAGRDMAPDQVKRQLDSTLADIEQYLNWQRSTSNDFNQRLATSVRQSVEVRKTKLLADRNLVAGLGFPIKQRADMPTTYATPDVRRKLHTPPAAASAPFKPEPVLDEANYRHILNIIENMTVVMERSPTAFAEMGEENIRQHYLVQLNGHFEGAATGETFNHQGKTDILIRVDGRNIFIAECKFWRGEKQFIETIDQILSYLSWRDTKAAIILFNRNKDFTQVLARMQEAMNTHQHRKQGPKVEGETRFRYVFGNPTDHGREIALTVMAFDVPSSSAG
jgi:hypothetical protein